MFPSLLTRPFLECGALLEYTKNSKNVFSDISTELHRFGMIARRGAVRQLDSSYFLLYSIQEKVWSKPRETFLNFYDWWLHYCMTEKQTTFL